MFNVEICIALQLETNGILKLNCFPILIMLLVMKCLCYYFVVNYCLDKLANYQLEKLLVDLIKRQTVKVSKKNSFIPSHVQYIN